MANRKNMLNSIQIKRQLNEMAGIEIIVDQFQLNGVQYFDDIAAGCGKQKKMVMASHFFVCAPVHVLGHFKFVANRLGPDVSNFSLHWNVSCVVMCFVCTKTMIRVFRVESFE